MDLDKLNVAFEGSECWYYNKYLKTVTKFKLGKDQNSHFIPIVDAINRPDSITKIIPTQKAIDYLKSL